MLFVLKQQKGSVMDYKNLIVEIDEFLKKHALIAASYDPDYDEPGEMFNGPDSCELWNAARLMEQGHKPTKVNSSFGSGCYSPINDETVRKAHDDLVKKINSISI